MYCWIDMLPEVFLPAYVCMPGHLGALLALLTGKGVVIEAVMTAAQYRVDGAVVVESGGCGPAAGPDQAVVADPGCE
ncbi:hypothetical protein, partial [uncultured Duncaniella sp.]|uniref:hypothetical protein n=1 Tax=uncultured Duncaniella sp. TaxID=2768039 RepID=UPI0025B655CB